MSLLNFENVSKSFGSLDLLTEVSWSIEEDRRIGLIGPNGAGKTTIFKLILGLEEPTTGTLSKVKGLQVGYLPQNPVFPPEHTLHQEMLQAQPELLELEEKMSLAEAEMADPATAANPARLEKVMEKYSSLQDAFRARDGYSYEARVDEILHGMEFDKKDYHRRLSTFSGGEQTRLMIAKLLLTNPQLLLLDEPTNHLDVETCEWLEGFLKDYKGTLVCISHDRYFLDRVTSEIVELEDCELTAYPGNYSEYKKRKAEEFEKDLKDYELQKAFVERTEEFIRRNIAGQNTKQAQGRRKMLKKLERLERPDTREKKIKLGFYSKGPSGKDVVELKGVSKSFGERRLFAPFEGGIYRADRVGLIGPNGSGKSTLLKILCGKEPPTRGTVKLGGQVKLGYYDQFQENLSPENKVMDEIWNLIPQAPQQEVRGILGRFLYSGDEVEKKVANLSGGEKSRLTLAKLVMEGPNFLVLDEPTNHLDISSREVVEEALDEFEGTLLVVTHDRYFLNREVNRIWEICGDRIVQYNGNYSEYLEKKGRGGFASQTGSRFEEPEEAEAAPSAPAQPKAAGEPGDRDLRKEQKRLATQTVKRLQEIEHSISGLEKKKKELEDEFANPELATNADAMKDLKGRYQQASDELDFLFNKWQELQSRMEAAAEAERQA